MAWRKPVKKSEAEWLFKIIQWNFQKIAEKCLKQIVNKKFEVNLWEMN